MPYADVRLIECVLRIPTMQRVERGGHWALREDALGEIMPDEFRRRQRQPSWEPTFARAARRTFPRISELVSEGDWLSAPYSDRGQVSRWLAELTQRGEEAPAKDCIVISDLAAVEAWIRGLMRYDAHPRWRDD
jgi:hypothetical protein